MFGATGETSGLREDWGKVEGGQILHGLLGKPGGAVPMGETKCAHVEERQAVKVNMTLGAFVSFPQTAGDVELPVLEVGP